MSLLKLGFSLNKISLMSIRRINLQELTDEFNVRFAVPGCKVAFYNHTKLDINHPSIPLLKEWLLFLGEILVIAITLII